MLAVSQQIQTIQEALKSAEETKTSLTGAGGQAGQGDAGRGQIHNNEPHLRRQVQLEGLVPGPGLNQYRRGPLLLPGLPDGCEARLHV